MAKPFAILLMEIEKRHFIAYQLIVLSIISLTLRENQWGRFLPFAIIKLNSSRFKTKMNAVPNSHCETNGVASCLLLLKPMGSRLAFCYYHLKLSQFYSKTECIL